MADPQHQEPLDGFDILTVRLYRAGLVGQALTLLIVGILGLTSGAPLWCWALYSAFVALTAWNMHLYMKTFRWIMQGASWIGLTLLVLGHFEGAMTSPLVGWAGIGFLFVSSSAWALKERYCFAIVGMRAVPLFLAGSLLGVFGQGQQPWAIPLLIAGGLMTMLSVAKLRMPLHFDIGDKSKYQV